jgi:hypothetical protein
MTTAQYLGELDGDMDPMGYRVETDKGDPWWRVRINEKANRADGLFARVTAESTTAACAVEVFWGDAYGRYEIAADSRVRVDVTSDEIQDHDDSRDLYVTFECEDDGAASCQTKRKLEVWAGMPEAWRFRRETAHFSLHDD